MVRFGIVDDHPSTRAGVIALLAPRMQCVLEESSLVVFLDKLTTTPTDVVIADLTITNVQGALVVTKILARCPGARILVFSMRDGVDARSVCYGAGAQGFVSKSSDAKRLVEAVEVVGRGDVYFEPGMAEQISLSALRGHRAFQDPKETLTSRELELFKLIAMGLSTKEIAKEMCIDAKTVRNKSSVIHKKLGVDTKQFPEMAREYHYL